jgi:hypothetical protein
MASIKFQAGEAYADEEDGPAYTFDDPAKIAQDLMKELAAIGSQVSLPDVINILQGLTQKPLDDKKGYASALLPTLLPTCASMMVNVRC